MIILSVYVEGNSMQEGWARGDFAVSDWSAVGQLWASAN